MASTKSTFDSQPLTKFRAFLMPVFRNIQYIELRSAITPQLFTTCTQRQILKRLTLGCCARRFFSISRIFGMTHSDGWPSSSDIEALLAHALQMRLDQAGAVLLTVLDNAARAFGRTCRGRTRKMRSGTCWCSRSRQYFLCVLTIDRARVWSPGTRSMPCTWASSHH